MRNDKKKSIAKNENQNRNQVVNKPGSSQEGDCESCRSRINAQQVHIFLLIQAIFQFHVVLASL